MSIATTISLDEGANNQVAKVTLFPRQAHVTRVATAQTVNGLNRVLLAVQAFEVDPDSVQARVFAHGEILSVQIRAIPAKDAARESLRALEEEERELKRARAKVDAALAGLTRQTRLLDAVVDFATVQVPREIQTAMPAVDQLQALLTYLDQNDQILSQRRETLERQAEDLGRDLEVAQRKLKHTRKQPKEDKAIEILFRSEGGQSTMIEASYLVSRAGWRPVYKIDVDAAQNLALTLNARIQQDSGEDWDGVEIGVSTAVPLKSGHLPRLEPWRLRAVEAPVMLAAAASFEAVEEAPSRPSRAIRGAPPAAPLPEATVAMAREQDQGSHFEYTLVNLVDLPSGPQDTLLPLRRYQPRGSFFHYTAPRVDPLVYRVCEITPDAALPEGPLNIHHQGQFIGATRLEEKRPGEPWLLNLGADRGVRATLDKQARQKSETFFGKVDRGHVAEQFVFELRVENLKNDAIVVWVFDHVPVSETDRFQVKGLDLQPAPRDKDYQGREGVMAWTLRLEPGSTDTIHERYAIKYPRDNPPEGLPD